MVSYIFWSLFQCHCQIAFTHTINKLVNVCMLHKLLIYKARKIDAYPRVIQFDKLMQFMNVYM